MQSLERLARIQRSPPPRAGFALAALLDVKEEGTALREGGEPSDAQSASELADQAAFELMRGERRRDPRAFGRALRAAHLSLALDPANERAVFNQALALEQLHLLESARAAWLRFAELSDSQEWRSEAEQHLAMLERDQAIAPADGPAAQTSPTARELSAGPTANVRSRFMEEALPAWADETRSPCQAAPTWRRLGQELEDASGDTMVLAVTEWLESELCVAGASSARPAVRHLLEAIRSYERSEPTASLDRLRRARAALSASGGGLDHLLSFYEGACLFDLSRYSESEEKLADLESRARPDGFLFLAARAAWLRGSIALRRQNLAGALDHYQRARSLLDEIDDRPHRAAIRGLLAETLARMGRFAEAWTVGLQGLGLARELRVQRRLYTGCALMATIAGLDRAYEVAASFQECAVLHVRYLGNPSALTDALSWQAAWLARSGDHERSLELARAARESARAINDEGEKAQANADLDMIVGGLALRDAPDQAVRTLSRAISFFDEVGHHYYGADARMMLASALLRTGDSALAEHSLQEALTLHEAFRLGDEVAESRLASLQSSHSVYDRLARLYLDRGEPWRALFFADRGRQDRQRGNAAPGRTALERDLSETLVRWKAAVARLPPRVELIATSHFGDEIVLWRLSAARPLTVERVQLPRPGLPSLSGGLSPRGSMSQLGTVFDGANVDGITMVFVADKLLNDIPFARLQLATGDSLVAAGATVAVATSVDDFLATGEAGASGDGFDRLTALLAPQTGDAAAELPTLAINELELTTLRRAFGHLTLLTGRNATAERFLESLGSSGILHFSGHVVLDPSRPTRSFLALSPDSEHPDGSLTAAELYGVRRARPLLVNLAGCNSGAAPRGLPLSLTLVRPLIQAGTPAVIGNLRPVADDLLAAFAASFYPALQDSRDPVAAFRHAQLALRAKARPGDTTWAEIQLYLTSHALGKGEPHA